MNLTELIQYPFSYRGRFNDLIELQEIIPFARKGDFAYVGLPYTSAFLQANWDFDAGMWVVINDVNYDITVDVDNVDVTVPVTDFFFSKKFMIFDNIDPINVYLPNEIPVGDVQGLELLRVGQYITLCKKDGSGTVTVVGENSAVVYSRNGNVITNDNHVYSVIIEQITNIGPSMYIDYRIIG